MQEPETKATVMVVDDSKTVRTLVSSIIEKSGHTSLTAADGDICIELINAHQIDFCFSMSICQEKVAWKFCGIFVIIILISRSS